MVSTPEYYKVCADLIKEVCEAFGNPEFFHLGLDEENAANQVYREFVHIRNNKLWWHDAYFYFDEVEKKVYAFSDAGSGQTYWLAKCFIILGDSFVESGELKQAKATFESVRDGYEPSKEGDDVQDNVLMRLRKLDEMIAG